jgi:hypothetical protein
MVAFFGVVSWQRQYIEPDVRLDVAMLLMPITATYFMAVVRSAVQRRNVRGSDCVTAEYGVIVGLVTLAFCGALLYITFSFPEVVGPTTAELKRWIVVVEIAFGAGFGLIAEDLFGKIEKVVIPEGQK